MKTIENITWESIDISTPEGQLLKTSVAVLCALCFKDKKPSIILEVIKDVKLHPFIAEPIETTIERMIIKHAAKNN